MKKYLVLAIMFFVSACAQGPIVGAEDCEYKHTPRKSYRVSRVAPRPAPIVVQQAVPCNQPAPVVVSRPQQPCNDCQPTTRTTREPVEILYKKVTYTTTYEPKTTSSITYERETVTNPTVQEIKVKKPVVKEIVVEQPTVSKVIETQVTQEPVKISIEEIK